MKQKKEIFLIPYSHLDTQWRWEYPTTIKKYLRKTLEESIYMFKKYPDHRFNFTGALRYSMMKEYFPDLFAEVKDLIADGRWALAGTCLDETDALVPSSESMIRNILYGDRWQQREFGRSSRDYMIPDCFGFPANMPTILSHCGIKGFSTNKLTWASAAGIPFEIGVWQGPDGSEIVSALNPCRYDSHLELPVFLNPGRLARLRRLGRKNNIWKSFQYYGVGDIGGAPTEGSVKRALLSIRHYDRKAGVIKVRQGSADEFFAEVTEAEKKRMDRYAGDLLLINHSAGTLTSAAIMKRWNRKNEQLAFAAEAAALTANLLTGADYPRAKIESAWQRTIGSQMHDILPGTSTPTAYEYSQNDEVIALNTWTSILEDAAEAIAPLAAGDGDILLYNPLAAPRTDRVMIDISHRTDLTEGPAQIRAADGTIYPAQLFRNDDGMLTAVFHPALESLTWARFNLSASDPGSKTDNAESSSPRISRKGRSYILENDLIAVVVDEDGALTSIFDKEQRQELLAQPMAYELQREKPKQFPAWNMDWRDQRRPAAARLEGGEVSIINEGSERCSLRIRLKHKKSLFVKDVSLDAGSRNVEFTEHIDWRESGYALKLTLNTALAEPELTYNWETSRINRGVNHKSCFETPSRMWVEMKEKDWGVSVIEDSKYGWDHPSGNTLRMTLVYTPAVRFYNGFKDQASHDWGHHTICYAIHPHAGGWTGTDALARAFNQPVRSFRLDGDAVSGPAVPSLVKLSSPDAGVMAVKMAEDSEDLIIRLYERRGTGLSTKVRFCSHVCSVNRVNGLEQTIEYIPSENNNFTAEIGANSVETYLVKFEKRTAVSKADSYTMPLPLDTGAFSANNWRSGGLYPAELVPETMASGGLRYQLSKEAGRNALTAAGQTLKIPAGTSRISLLLASDVKASSEFCWLDADKEIISREAHEISTASGFIGQWETRTWKKKPRHFLKYHRDYAWLNRCTGVKPGYVNRQRLEWYSTHTHLNGEDQAYRYGYMYTLRLDVVEGAVMLMLPDNPAVKVFAASASALTHRVREIRALTDSYDY